MKKMSLTLPRRYINAHSNYNTGKLPIYTKSVFLSSLKSVCVYIFIVGIFEDILLAGEREGVSYLIC